jgi:hypothetical protein
VWVPAAVLRAVEQLPFVDVAAYCASCAILLPAAGALVLASAAVGLVLALQRWNQHNAAVVIFASAWASSKCLVCPAHSSIMHVYC